jgi:hypothetical protein
MRVPAFWYEGDYHPAGVTHGYLLDYNDEGEPIVEPPGGGRETLVPSEHLVLRARCSACGDWTQHIDATGTHLVCTSDPPPLGA